MGTEFYYNDAATWRKARELYYNDAATWRKAKELWYNDAGTWRKVFSGVTILGSLTAGTSSWDNATGLSASGQITFKSDGTIAYGGTGTTNNNVPGSTSYVVTPAAGAGSSVYIKATVTGGTLTSNPAAAYTLLSSDLAFIKGPATTGALVTATVTFDLSYDGVTAFTTSAGWSIGYTHS